jgi:hypothetical protein
MRTVSRSVVAGALGLAVALGSGCESAGTRLAPGVSTTTLTAGWEQWFTLDWTVESGRNDTRRIRGYVVNRHGQTVEPLRLLTRAFDASGAVVDQRLDWVLGGISGGGRAYFEISKLPPAARYVVTVWDYTVQSESIMN